MSDEVKCPMAKRIRLENPTDLEQSVEDAQSIDGLRDKLREFNVLDEVPEISDGENGDVEDGDVEDGDESASSGESDVDIEELLDAELPDELNRKKENQYDEKFKIVMEEKGKNHFEVLPEGWLQATHNSGIPIYLHKSTRVCTVAKPYFLGPGSVRKHEIPLSAIPCLNYRRALDEEEKLKGIAQQAELDVQTPPDEEVSANGSMPGSSTEPAKPTIPRPLRATAKIETVTEAEKARSLTSDEITDYCRSLFRFRTIRVMRFKSWAARRKFTKNRKNIKHLQRPTLPDGTKLITFPVIEEPDESGAQQNQRPKKEWVMNPNGKSFVCILHEYVQHALKKQPAYEFKELDNAATPYSATVTITGIKYGTGFGTSKKQAKSEAAKETLEVLIPEMRDKITGLAETKKKSEEVDLSVFNEIKIEDPRVAEFCAKTTEPSPHAILLTCLQRNFGIGDVQIKYDINTVKNKKNEFTMTCGRHTATVLCKNKKEGKQRASQAILQKLHPHIKTWGSLLRLYGNRSVKTFKEKKAEEQEITVLQSKAAINQPNWAILNKLREEMLKLRERRNEVVPIGTFRPGVELPRASGSKNVEL